MITSTKITAVQAKIKRAIAQIEKDENVTIKFGSCSYNSAYYGTKMTVTSNDKGDEKVNSVYTNLSKQYGFTQNIIGMEFSTGSGTKHKITEFRTRAPKFPIITMASDGKSYKFTVDQAKRYLGGDKLINRTANLDKLVP